MNSSKWTLGFVMAAIATVVFVGATQGATILLDDHFDNGDLATGGVNGGFTLRTNSVGGTPTALEVGTDASVTTNGGSDNSGIVSNSSLDLAGQAGGFSMTFVITSVSSDPDNNGMFVGIQTQNAGFFRDFKNYGLVFSGNEPRTSSAGGFGMIRDDIGSGGAATVFDDDDLELASLRDGFTATITATPTGWSYEITGVNNTGGTPTTFSGADTWVNSGEAASFYTDQFDNADHVGVWTQRGGGGSNITTFTDRVTVTAIPEPASLVLLLAGAAGVVFRKRNA